MIQLHVWGLQDKVSIISPQCVASVWLACLVLDSKAFEVVTSNNTNLSTSGEFPILLLENGQCISGYLAIALYLLSNYTSLETLQVLNNRQQLINVGLVSQLTETLEIINQYNLFINTTNYEKYTRKLLSNFYPFPMMYNLSLSFYNTAQQKVKLLGLDKSKTSLFNFSSNNADVVVAETETVNSEQSDSEDVGEEGTNKGISGLHERYLLQKSKTKEVLKESKASMRCLMKVEKYVNEIESLKESENGKEEKRDEEKEKEKEKDDNQKNNRENSSYIFGNLPSSGDILFLACIYCLTSKEIPDRFIQDYLSSQKASFSETAKLKIDELQKNTITNCTIRPPKGREIPSLYNEVMYWTGYVKY
ncbi:hypothetical protein LELG_01107 [Lodderomyces elongisporus NRRL YB-4239]|uniref:Mitochondrial outer membrane transport complex Sam37/metaxin N-terminal domain-containing protein n=1 Tax=Lodderomyces elongisporus (strain ATCC 11503 / CBS 2605 / JCM 1781 / NBRC 1676 / NRRL YB-4239) TaxID=379508 RepID=A5DUS1_LODEL|nr:hypothetical protein LELG_01107 [Lodderomyces elongisporus NRRL YB-4239]